MSLISNRFLRFLQQMTVEHQPCMHRSILPIFYCQIRTEKGGGSVTKRIQSERGQEAVIFKAHPPTPHPPPSIFLWKIDYLPVLGLRADLLRMFDAFTRL